MSRLIEAGLEVFSAVGYDAATTRMVAERAGTNEALIARYFRGKAGLLTAIIVASISEAEIAAQDYPRGKNAETEIRNFMLHRLDHESARREFIRIGISRAAVDLKIRQEISKIVPIHGSPVLTSRLVDLQKKTDA